MVAISSVPVSRERRARDEYDLGIAFFQKKQWRTAARHFSQAECRCGRGDACLPLYRSWHGLALVYSGDVCGLNLCRNAAASENIHATVFQNLVLAELHFRHRKRACATLQRGLSVDPKHRGLLKLRRSMGVRRQPCLGFLDRDNLLNKWIGRLTYRHTLARGGRR